MTTGAGIALAGIWVFAGLYPVSESKNNIGKWVATTIAIIFTFLIA